MILGPSLMLCFDDNGQHVIPKQISTILGKKTFSRDADDGLSDEGKQTTFFFWPNDKHGKWCSSIINI